MTFRQCAGLMPSVHFSITSLLPRKTNLSYSVCVAAQSATGCGSPISKRRTGATFTILGAFFSPVISFYGSCAREAFAPAGFSFCPGLPHLRTAATHHVEVMLAAPIKQLEHHPMKHTHAQNPSIQNRIAALKARAISALHADSSLHVRLSRYNTAMAKARALETKENRHAAI